MLDDRNCCRGEETKEGEKGEAGLFEKAVVGEEATGRRAVGLLVGGANKAGTGIRCISLSCCVKRSRKD